MGLAKAMILVLNPTDLTKVKEQIAVQFNPEEYSLNKDNNFASQAIPGLSSPILQFVNGNLRTLEMELFFDTLDDQKDVRTETEKVVKLLKIDSEVHAPPILRFVWASLDFTCVLTRANQKFTRFMTDGRPVRARVTVSFSEFIDGEREAKEVNRQTADFSKVHAVVGDETLSDLAAKFYNNAQTWRPIAIANGIDDPRSVFPGQILRIPSLPFVDQE
jgi:hypothetical protein